MKRPSGYLSLLESVRARVEEGVATFSDGVGQLADEIQQDATAWATNDLSATPRPVVSRRGPGGCHARPVPRSGARDMVRDTRA